MDNLIARAIGQLGTYFNKNDERYEKYKKTELDERDFGKLIVNAIEQRVVPVTKVPNVITEWRRPTHDEFADRNAWSLFNAFTETFTEVGRSSDLMKRNHALHGMMDNFCGLAMTR